MSLDFISMRLLIACILFLTISCRDNSHQRVIEIFKQKWDKEYYGDEFQSRGENVFLVHKIGCGYAYYFKYWLEGDSLDYTVNKEFYERDCVIDVDSSMVQYFKFYMSLHIKELDSRTNQFETVELLLPNEDCIYYIGKYYKLPNESKKWLKDYSDQIEPNFFYVESEDRIECRSIVYAK